MIAHNLPQALQEHGVSRQQFLKFCTTMDGVLALPHAFGTRIAQALQEAQRTPVIWYDLRDCAGCTESFLRASRPSVAELVLGVLSVDCHETIMAASSHLAEQAKQPTIDAGGYLLLVRGSIPTAEEGIAAAPAAGQRSTSWERQPRRPSP